ncbi:hypothetical protein DIS24_g60 [Lasiodiplodia hormozganensis]|uniref:Uncharacterized protein n=1 Tax=Lasiodiplodia hormozganensis TaxID=869390 RepID=A0AA40D6N2_9PEZI|nr:hypothetical protein DIS24_g60 [Lasiodiplodia hormozganensis]
MLFFYWLLSLLSFTPFNPFHFANVSGKTPDKPLPLDTGYEVETTTAFSVNGLHNADFVASSSAQEVAYAPESKTLDVEMHGEPEPVDVVAPAVKVDHIPLVTHVLSYSLSQLLVAVALIGSRPGLQSSWLCLFVILFLFRYVRLVVHIIAYNSFKAKPVLENPTFTAKDVTVIMPTVEPRGEAFEECIHRVVANGPAKVLVVTVGHENIGDATEYCKALSPSILVLSVPAPSKREQVKRAIPEIETAITVLCDDTVFWPETFLTHVLAPFEDGRVGIVGTCKRVRRALGRFGLADFWNLCGVMRLERTNFDLASTNAVDGGVSCVSGRTCAVRSCILQEPAFQEEFTSEYIFWKRFGPLNAGDDKWMTRWVMKRGWTVFHQSCPEVRIETILGVKGGGARFRGQCLRWARSSARDNPKMIFRDGLWRRYPWTAYAVLATSIVNYAMLYDPLLVYTLHKAMGGPDSRPLLLLLVLWILATKFVRPASHYWRHPGDLVYAPFIILFGYYHSWIKLHALMTCWDISWGTRAGIDAAAKFSKAA